MNKRGSEGSDETTEKQYLWIAYLVLAVIIFLAAANFVKTNATKQAFERDIQSEELATLTDVILSSPRQITVKYPNSCCEYEFKDGRVFSSLSSDVIPKNYPLISSDKSIKAGKVKGDLTFKKTAGGIEINGQ